MSKQSLKQSKLANTRKLISIAIRILTLHVCLQNVRMSKQSLKQKASKQQLHEQNSGSACLLVKYTFVRMFKQSLKKSYSNHQLQLGVTNRIFGSVCLVQSLKQKASTHQLQGLRAWQTEFWLCLLAKCTRMSNQSLK